MATQPTQPQQQYAPAPSILDAIVKEQTENRARIAERYRPVMSSEEFVAREKALAYLVENLMIEGVDYGYPPGTKPSESKQGEYKSKPCLFKAGAERACAFFGYAPVYAIETEIEEWTNEKYGEPLFYYKIKCTLEKDSKAVGQGIGSATTWESKYRYRNADRTCPECGKTTIIKGKTEYGGGWICFAKKGGCGAKFIDGDATIEGQATGKVPNPDVADVINTVQKMGQKRAYVAATLSATGLSGRFTQDLEDLPAPPAEPHEKLVERRIAETKANVEAGKPAFQATDDDLPPNMGGPPLPDKPGPSRVEQARENMTSKPIKHEDFVRIREEFEKLGVLAEYDRIVKDNGAAPGKIFPDRMKPAKAAFAALQDSLESLRKLNGTSGESDTWQEGRE